MFEKEAEEWVKKEFPLLDVEHINLEESITEYRAYKDGAEFGYNKANEWHYVKDGKYPTHSNRVLVFTDEGVGFGIYGLDNKKWYTYDTGFDVIAWKEIVLPKGDKRKCLD